MIGLIARVLVGAAVKQTGKKLATTAKNAAGSAAETMSPAAAAAKSAAGAVGQMVSEASTVGRGTADAVGQAATQVSSLATSAVAATGEVFSEAFDGGKAAGNAVGRAAVGVSTIATDAAGAVGHAVAAVSSKMSVGWPQNNEIGDETPAASTLFVPQRAKLSNVLRPSIIIFAGIWFAVSGMILLIWLRAYRAGDVIGVLEAFIIVAAFFSATFWLCREGLAWRRLAVAQELQRDLSDDSDAAQFRAAVRRLRRAVREPSLGEFIDGADRSADAAMLREQLDVIGLRGVDENAIEAIRRGTRDVFFLSFLSTNAVIDTAAFSIRALGMIRRVALAYGHRPGRFGTLRLARHILADIALLPIGMMIAVETVRGAGSALHHVARSATTLGTAALAAPIPEPTHKVIGAAALGFGLVGEAAAKTAESVTARVAEAALAAGRMGHLGLLTVAHVRPVPLSRSSYGRMRNAIYKQILGLRKDAARQKKQLLK